MRLSKERVANLINDAGSPRPALTRAAVSLLWHLNALTQRPEVVFLTGSPRSGTTWVLESFERALYCRRNWEPVSTHFVARALERGDPLLVHARPDNATLAADSDLRWLVSDAIAGRVPRDPRLGVPPSDEGRLAKAARVARARPVIVKFVQMQRAVPWLAQQPDIRGCVLLRNPLAVVASQIRHATSSGAGIDPNWTEEIITRVHPILNPADLQHPVVKSFLGRPLSVVERLAVTACLDLLAAIDNATSRQRFVYVLYEHLVLAPEIFADVIRRLDLSTQTIAPAVAPDAPSFMAGSEANVRKGRDPRVNWERRMSPQQIEEVLAIMAAFGIEFYGLGPEPGIEALGRRQFASLVVPENGGEKVGHGSGGMSPLRAAQ
jgi:hypothetical protein